LLMESAGESRSAEASLSVCELPSTDSEASFNAGELPSAVSVPTGDPVSFRPMSPG
jgi:hypothetical protein